MISIETGAIERPIVIVQPSTRDPLPTAGSRLAEVVDAAPKPKMTGMPTTDTSTMIKVPTRTEKAADATRHVALVMIAAMANPSAETRRKGFAPSQSPRPKATHDPRSAPQVQHHKDPIVAQADEHQRNCCDRQHDRPDLESHIIFRSSSSFRTRKLNVCSKSACQNQDFTGKLSAMRSDHGQGQSDVMNCGISEAAASLDGFHPAVSSWFRERFGEPTPPQRLGWPAISSGRNCLIVAPTGSGKTLAAFLAALDHLWTTPRPKPGVRILYISPLKALNQDIWRNLQVPLEEIQNAARRSWATRCLCYVWECEAAIHRATNGPRWFASRRIS